MCEIISACGDAMGDWFQTVVGTEVRADSAPAAADRLRAWLIEMGVVAGERSESVLGGDGMGYAPGANYARALAHPAPSLLSLVTNGVDIQSGRNVAIDPQAEWRWRCPSCAAHQTSSEDLLQAIGQWYEGADAARVFCPTCGHANPIARLVADPPIACGNLAITFWNWPPLSETFLGEISRLLGGSITVVCGKL
ncbi:MAG: hypothetical protein ABI609_16225 [Acidobacteriota bacterium]